MCVLTVDPRGLDGAVSQNKTKQNKTSSVLVVVRYCMKYRNVKYGCTTMIKSGMMYQCGYLVVLGWFGFGVDCVSMHQPSWPRLL